MIRKLSFAVAAIVAGLSIAGPSGVASTAGSLGVLKSVGAMQSNVQKTWGWHRTCRRGLNGYHKHVPGIGRVQCTAHRCSTNSQGVRRCRWF